MFKTIPISPEEIIGLLVVLVELWGYFYTPPQVKLARSALMLLVQPTDPAAATISKQIITSHVLAFGTILVGALFLPGFARGVLRAVVKPVNGSTPATT
jgi:hypothetical protein